MPRSTNPVKAIPRIYSTDAVWKHKVAILFSLEGLRTMKIRTRENFIITYYKDCYLQYIRGQFIILNSYWTRPSPLCKNIRRARKYIVQLFNIYFRSLIFLSLIHI